MSSTSTKAEQMARDQGLIAGFPKRMANAQILVNGVTYTEQSAVAFLQGRVQVATKVVTTKAAYLAAVKAADAEEIATAGTVSGLVEAIYVAFGDDPAALADFGLPARKKAHRTPAQYLEAAAKAKATRLARHTMSAKAKAAIKGTVPATAASASAPVTVTPVQTGSAATTAAT